ncbi:MAG: hypothetical protein K6A77_10575 [Clostridiales bacterium]|nr:hypothetical protein [Clostridiales bacterium]
MPDKTYKNLFDDGYTTYHDDGTKSTTYKNLLDDGVTTYHSDGSKSTTYNNILDNGTTTYHSDGSKSTTYKNILDDGYTTYNSDGTKTKSYTYNNFLDDGTTTYSYTYGQPTNTYGSSYTDPYGDYGSIPSVPYYYGGSASIDTTPYRINENAFPVWALAMLWVAYGLLMIPAVWASFHTPEQTQHIWIAITCCLLASWSGIQMTKRPGFCELFVCFILSFGMCLLNMIGGYWTHLLLIVPVGFILYIYLYSGKLNVNYFGKLHGIYMWATAFMVINAVFYLVKWRMGCQIMMLFWLALTLIFLVVNLVQKIISMIKTKQFLSFHKMKGWVMFAIGVAIPLIMKVLQPSMELWICGLIGLGLFLAAGIICTGKEDKRRFIMYTLSFTMISFVFCQLIYAQAGTMMDITNMFGQMDRQIGFSLTQPVVAFLFHTIEKLADFSAQVCWTITDLVIRLGTWIADLVHINLPDYLAAPNYILACAFCVVPTVVITSIGTAIGKALRKEKKAK